MVKQPLWAVLVVAAVMSGCAGQESASTTPDAPADSTVGDQLHHEGWLNTTFSMANGVAGDTGDGPNCAAFDEEDVTRITAGYVEVSWSGETSGTQLELVVSATRTLRTEGPSPLRIELSDVIPREPLLGFMLQPKSPGATGPTMMWMHWEFTQYDGIQPLPYRDMACGA